MKLVLKETTGTPPTFHFELHDEDQVVGRLQLRQTPSKENSYPEGYESHFYYEIESEYAEEVHGTEIIRLGLREAKNIGLRRVTLTCSDEKKASQKSIQANGAQFISSKLSSDGELIHKYTVDFS